MAPVRTLDAERIEVPRDRARQLCVVLRQDAGQRLHHRHRRAELGEGGSELEPDIAGADHDEPVGAAGERQRVGGGDHGAAEGEGRQLHRQRAGGDDDGLGADDLKAGLGLDLDGLAVAEAGPAGDRFHPRPLQQPGDAGGQPPDDAVLPGDGAAEVQRRLLAPTRPKGCLPRRPA